MTRLRRFLALAALAVSVVLLPACDSQEEDTPAGLYLTSRFEVEIDGEPTNVLAAGGRLEMVLRTNGTAWGRLVVPAELAEGEETEIEFEGTYSVSDDRVTFDHEADTFIRDVTWTYDSRRLEAQTDEITVVLVRQGLD